MGLEIERKYLVVSDGWKSIVSSSHVIKQGYLSADPVRTVRVRIVDKKGILTIKGKSENLTRPEFEYDIPLSEAHELLGICEKPLIEKVRHHCHADGHLWEVDVFEGDNAGLVVAEIELDQENESFFLPEWVGKEVSGDPRYYNSALVKVPFSKWNKDSVDTK